jgi:hypothetical protein
MKINNCYFCGSGEHVKSGHYHNGDADHPEPNDSIVFFAGCWMCDVYVCYGDSEEEAIKKWNGELIKKEEKE